MWDKAQEWAWKEVAEVRRAPTAIVLVFVLGLLAGAWLAKQFYGERMEVLELLRHAQSVSITATPVPAQTVISLLPYGRRVDITIGIIWLMLLGGLWWKVRQVTQLRRIGDASYELLRTAAHGNAEVTAERDQALVALRDAKQAHAMEVLEGYSNAVFLDNIKPTVMVRYCHYAGDDELALKIKGLFTQYVKWAVELDGSNNPALLRAEQFKVVFDVGKTLTYRELVNAFSEGDLLGVTVGVREFTDRQDSERLIVLVLPSVETHH